MLWFVAAPKSNASVLYTLKVIFIDSRISRLLLPRVLEMETTNRAMASGLLVLLLLMNMGFVLPVRADCWEETSILCQHTHECRKKCQERGEADGHCKWPGLPDLAPFCFCLRPNCS